MTQQQYLKQWLTKAEHDLTIIRQGMDRPEQEWVSDVLCFHAQQVIEKTLKAYLIFLEKDPPRTHSLELLLEAARAETPDLPDYDLEDLTTYAVQARYPDELVDPDSAEVKQYAKLAETVLKDLRFRMGQ